VTELRDRGALESAPSVRARLLGVAVVLAPLLVATLGRGVPAADTAAVGG
jgi:hypothetical protein